MSNRDKFQPRAQTCSQCNQVEELEPRDPTVLQCKKFGWLISKNLSKTQAVCKK